MTMFKKIADVAYAIAHFHWIEIYKTDKKLDDFINRVIDDDMVEKLDKNMFGGKTHTCTLKTGEEIWISNWPFGYGSIYAPQEIKLLPYKRTRARLRKYLKKKFDSKPTEKQKLEEFLKHKDVENDKKN